MNHARTMTLYGVGAAILAFLGLLFGLTMCGASVQINADAATTTTVPIGRDLKPGVIPEQYRELIPKAAHTCPEITAPLLAAQIQQESKWNPNAVSPKGAKGIAQFMPDTWTAVGRDYNGDGIANAFDPGDAIPAQAKYMCDQVAQIRRAGIPGDIIDLALAAYNAGFGNVLKYRTIPPFKETRNYVRIIRQLAAEYAQGASAPPTGGGGGGGGGWVYPLLGTRATCTSGFGERWGEFHRGQDMAQAIGTPIGAGADGTVIAAGPASGYGLWVKVQHAGNVVTIYGHINEYTVSVGQVIKAGQHIATLGNRGQSTGPHLHYQIEVGGKAVNPQSFYQANGGPPLC